MDGFELSAANTPLDQLVVIDPDYFARHGYPHEAWARLRREAPVYWCERESHAPFWAIVKYADIVDVSRQPDVFRNGPRLELIGAGGGPPVHTIITLDPPRHGRVRRLASKHFTARAVSALEAGIDRIVEELLDALPAEGRCEFVDAFAAPLPIAVICQALGVPRERWREMFAWTNQSVAAIDPEYTRPGMTPKETQRAAHEELFGYFAELVQERRREPRNDLITHLARADLDGEPLPMLDLLAYYLVLVSAGNETTRNALSRGLLAFLEHPDEWARLQADPALLDPAVEEVLRWTSPVAGFARTAARDSEVRGQKIRTGEALGLLYASANRDEDVFDEPNRFRIDRSPNRHLAFGVGEHFCLGAHLARLELRAAFRHLALRIEHMQLDGPVERVRVATLGAVKRMPIRYALRA